MTLNDSIATTGDDICQLFATQFASTFSVNSSTNRAPTCSQTFPQFTLHKIYFSEREVFKSLNRIDVTKGAGPDRLPPLFIKKCARNLACPLTLIFNRSLVTSQFPTEWKKANVVPIFKKGDSANVKNYRPISMLSIFSKLFESMICPVLTSHVKAQLSPQQHGFCSNKSTVTNLVSYLDEICMKVDSGQQIDALYTDFSSAFDKVDHKILLQKLHDLGIHGPLLEWFRSYLSERTQRVVVNGYESSEYIATSGVPQGSHTGPILFIVFINDIVDCIKHSQCSLFADDLKIYRQIKTQEDVALLQCDLNSLQNWCVVNGMALNASKCYHITFTRKKHPIPSSYSLDRTSLQKVENIRDLGVVLSSDLSFSTHIDNIIKKAMKVVGFINRVGKEFRGTLPLKVLYNTFVRSLLEYASPVWSPTYKIHIDRIERVQKKFTRCLRFKDHKCPYRADYEERLSYFKLDSLKKRRVLNDLLTLHKTVNGTSSTPDLLSKVKLDVPRHSHLRSKRTNSTFATNTCRTNLGRQAPLNRMLTYYNRACAIDSSIDIFFNSLPKFRTKITKIDL